MAADFDRLVHPGWTEHCPRYITSSMNMVITPWRLIFSPTFREVAPSGLMQATAPNDIVALRNAYVAHGADKDWITAWLAQKRDFSGEAVVVGATEDQAAPGADGAVRTVGFTSAARAGRGLAL